MILHEFLVSHANGQLAFTALSKRNVPWKNIIRTWFRKWGNYASADVSRLSINTPC